MPKTFLLYIEYENRKYPCELIPKKHNRNVRIRIAKTSGHRSGDDSPRPQLSALGKDQLDLFSQPATVSCVVKVSYPSRLSREHVQQTLTEAAAWIAKHFDKMQKELEQRANPILRSGSKVLFQGRKLILVFLPATRRKQKVTQDGTRLLCAVDNSQQQKIKKVLEQWYREQAATTIGYGIEDLAARITRKSYRIRIAGQKTQWGSCSAAGVLSFNWKLMMAPKYVLDYIMVHELAHLEEMNHSQRFWNLVRTHCRNLDRAKGWLKQHGARLDSI